MRQSQHHLMAVIALEIDNLSVTTKGYRRTRKCGFAAVYRPKSPPVLSGGLNGGENGGQIREQIRQQAPRLDGVRGSHACSAKLEARDGRQTPC